jgi:hypothetical protein
MFMVGQFALNDGNFLLRYDHWSCSNVPFVDGTLPLIPCLCTQSARNLTFHRISMYPCVQVVGILCQVDTARFVPTSGRVSNGFWRRPEE